MTHGYQEYKTLYRTSNKTSSIKHCDALLCIIIHNIVLCIIYIVMHNNNNSLIIDLSSINHQV